MECGQTGSIRSGSFATWVESLRSLDEAGFLQALQDWESWEWSRLDDLEPARPLLDRIHEMLTLQAPADTLDLLLERSLLVLKNTTSKTAYNSVDRLTDVLDHQDCRVVCKALTILQTLVVRVTQNIKLTKAHKNPQLCAKLYVIALGANLNSASSVSLKDLCTQQVDLSHIAFREEGHTKVFSLAGLTFAELQALLPEKYHFFVRNRQRMMEWSDTKRRRELAVCCQLLALSVLLQSTPDPSFLQDFCRTLPDLWLLPMVTDLLRQPLLPLLHSELVNDLTAILVMTEGQLLRNESSQNQVINSTYALLALWQQHGLLQTLLRDLTNDAPGAVPLETARNPEFVKAVLYLSSVCADYKSRSETAHVPGMTVSLLRMLDVPETAYPFRFSALSKAVRVLCVLVSQSIDMFKESQGMHKVLSLASYEMQQLVCGKGLPYSDLIGRHPNAYERSYFIRGLLRLIKIALSKWEQLPGLAVSEVRKLVGSQLMDSLRGVYESRHSDIFEQSIQLLSALINEQPSVVPDLIARGTLPALLQALETAQPPSPKLMAAISRVLCAISLHAEGAKLLEGFNTVAKLLQGLGTFEGVSLTNDLAVDIAESLQEVLSRVSSFKEKTVDGSLAMLEAFEKAPHPSQEKFFTQLTNIGRLLAVLFNFSGDLFRLFIDKNGFEYFLAILKLPILPQTFNNEFHGVLHLFKSLQGSTQSPAILARVLESIQEQMQLLESMVGELATVSDLSAVKSCGQLDLSVHDQLIVVLTRIDSLVEMVKQLVSFGGHLGEVAPALSGVLARLGDLMRVLIAEQARLSPLSTESEKRAPAFNIPIDIKDIENPDVKSFEENFYFTCQLSIRKLFRVVTRLGQTTRMRSPFPDDIAELLAKSMGEVLTRLVTQLHLDDLTQNRAYFYSLLLSDVVKVLAGDQCPMLIMLAFHQKGGLKYVLDFMLKLKELSFSMLPQQNLSFDLVNCLQILWNLGGKLLESMFQTKMSTSRDSPGAYPRFGVEQKEVSRLMQTMVLKSLESLGHLHCGEVSLAFAKSVIEIFRLAAEYIKAEPETSVAQKLQDMGFPERNVRGVLQQLGPRANLHAATEFMLKHSDIEPSEEDTDAISEQLSNLHIIVAESIRHVIPLSSSIAELLYRITQRTAHYVPEIVDCLIRQVHTRLASPADCEILTACLHPLAYLSTRCDEAVRYIAGTTLSNELLDPLSRFSELSSECRAKNQWLGHACALLETQVRFAGFSREKVTEAVIAMLSGECEFSEDVLSSLLQLLVTLSERMGEAKRLVQSGRLLHLLNCRLQGESRSKQVQTLFSTLLQQLSESPQLFKVGIQNSLLQWVSESKQSLKVLLEKCRPQISRNRELFKTIFSSVCRVTRSEKGAEVEERKEHEELMEEDWEIVSTIAQALRDQHAREQAGQTDRFLQTDHLVALLSDVVQTYPAAVQSLLSHDFISFLVRELIPFKYHLKLDSGKILFTFPGSQQSVAPQSYQLWVKSALKLLKVLTFKHSQVCSHPAVTSNLTRLNHPILKARKQLMRELNSALADCIKSGWFRDSKAVSLVRSCAIVIMQLLRESPKPPFATSNPAELAKGLLSDKYAIVKHLSAAAAGVDLHFKRAASVLNLLFAPLEILTRYGITFLLHSSKQQVPEHPEPMEEEVEVLDLDKYEFSGSDSNQQLSASPSGSEDDEGEEMSVDDDRSSIEEDVVEEEDEDEVHEESEGEDVEEEITEEQEEELGEDVVIVETRNTEPFWADVDQEEDMNDFRESWSRNIRPAWEPTLAQERQLVDPNMSEFDAESLHPQPIIVNHRSIDRRQIMEMDQMPMFRSDIETGPEEFIHVLFSRSRKEQPAKNPPKQQEEDLAALLEELSAGAEVCPVLQKPPSPAPADIDPTFLEALPEELRREVLVQQHPYSPAASFPAEVRSQEMDNASFIASLTPELRREVLRDCPEELLHSLPPEFVAEARVYQERQTHRIMPHIIPREAPPRRVEAEGSEVAEIDDKLAESLPRVDPEFLKLLLKALYLLTPVNREILASLVLNISAHGDNRKELLEAFVQLLSPSKSDPDFPPPHLYGSDTYLENSEQVFAIVAGRVLDILQFLTKHNPKVSAQLFDPRSQLFVLLVQLLQLPLFKTSPTHLSPLLTLLQEALEKIKKNVPQLQAECLLQLCEMLKYESLTDIALKVAQDLVSHVCEHSANRAVVQEFLCAGITAAAQELARELSTDAGSGALELQLLKLCKVYKHVSTDCDFSMLLPLWPHLAEALNSLTQAESDLASTASPLLSKLLPVIEAFFISHDSADDIFRLFCDKNKKVLNLVVRQNPALLEDTLNSLITRFHTLLDFENKRSYFKAELRRQRPDRAYETVRLHVRRTDVFEDSFHQLKNRPAQELLGKLRVQFMGEEGIDAGGVAREWYSLLAKEMFNPDYALFVLAVNGVSFQPNPLSAINAEHLQYFKFVGRTIGKALFDGMTLDVYFTRSFYKHILGQEISYQDIEDMDPDFYKSLSELLTMNLDTNELQEYYFVYTEERFGEVQQHELMPGGRDIRVTESNKMDYIKLLCDMKMTRSIEAQLTAFLDGFHEVIPQKLVSIFDAKELELLVAGLPEVDLVDLKNNTEYHNYSPESPIIRWFWETMEDFSQEERAEFIQFVTGSCKVPLEGFKALQGIGGVQKFQIHKSFTSPDRLPTAHTCMNQLDLPEYPTKEILHKRLKLAISEGKEGFGFA